MGGRDPLGLSRVAQTITDYLLTGIITQTDRARYYSFYCWAIWHIHGQESPKRFQDFVDRFRRREAAIALATVLNNEKTSPIGVTAVSAMIDQGRPVGYFNSDFRVLPSNQLGGYGQYYGGSIYQLGLTHRSENGMDLITEGIAESLSNTFHKSIKDTPYIKKRLFLEKTINEQELEASKKFLTIDALEEPDCYRERELLRNLFFAFHKEKLWEQDWQRRLTLAQILYIISKYEATGHCARFDNKEIDKYLVYPAYYYSVLLLDESTTEDYICPEIFANCRSLWRQYCLQQFVTQAIENLMYAVLEISGSESGGLSLNEIISRLIEADFFSILKNVTGNTCNDPWQLLEAFKVKKIPSEKDSINLQKLFEIKDEMSEVGILNLDGKPPSNAAAIAVLLLSCLYAKWRGIQDDIGCTYVIQSAGHELWMGSVIRCLDDWLKKDFTWAEAFRFMINNFVINQHERVMYEKKRLDSCWLNYVDGKVIKEQDYGPRWRSSRHKNAVTILRDLGLVAVSTDMQITITRDGSDILQKVMKE